MTHVTAHLHAVKEVCATRELLQTATIVAAAAVVVAVVPPEITAAAAQAMQERQQQRGSGEAVGSGLEHAKPPSRPRAAN
jgi:hypothetical protein